MLFASLFIATIAQAIYDWYKANIDLQLDTTLGIVVTLLVVAAVAIVVGHILRHRK